MRRHLFTIVALFALLVMLLFVFGAIRGYRQGQRSEHDNFCALQARDYSHPVSSGCD